MGRRSFFFKDYVAHLILIVCAFALAGVVFCYQMSSYALHAKQTELRTTVQSLAEQSKLLEGTDSDVIRQIYMLSIARVAKEDELTVLITDADGNIEMGAKPDGTTYTLPGYHISAEVVAEMHKNGSYASVGSLGVLSESSFYTVGTCVKDDNGDADLMIFVSTQDPNSAGVVRHSTQTLVLIMLVTLVVMLVISFMISQHVTRPLKTIAAAAKEFAGGNFDVRVPEDNRCYEIDELAVSFNNMARDLDQLEELTRGFISNVKVDVDFTSSRKTASIVSAIPDKEEAKPGELEPRVQDPDDDHRRLCGRHDRRHDSARPARQVSEDHRGGDQTFVPHGKPHAGCRKNSVRRADPQSGAVRLYRNDGADPALVRAED